MIRTAGTAGLPLRRNFNLLGAAARFLKLWISGFKVFLNALQVNFDELFALAGVH